MSPAICPRACFLCGPTASGKSELAVAVAEHIGGEIVGADAFQVYAGLDILSAKPSPALRARVPHHLIGEIPLETPWDVAQWLAAARERIAEIHARGRLPLVVGGTGLYLRALTRGLADLPQASPELRAELAARPLADLQAQLQQLDPAGALAIDLKNPRRVVRALEVCLITGRPFSETRTQWEAPQNKLLGVVLHWPRQELCERIKARTDAMFAQGVVEEVRNTPATGPTAGQMLGLREIRSFLAGETSEADCREAIERATRQYAKRQETWFRRETALRVQPVHAGSDLAALSQDLAREALQFRGA